jgi:hypothetical protein
VWGVMRRGVGWGGVGWGGVGCGVEWVGWGGVWCKRGSDSWMEAGPKGRGCISWYNAWTCGWSEDWDRYNVT